MAGTLGMTSQKETGQTPPEVTEVQKDERSNGGQKGRTMCLFMSGLSMKATLTEPMSHNMRSTNKAILLASSKKGSGKLNTRSK